MSFPVEISSTHRQGCHKGSLCGLEGMDRHSMQDADNPDTANPSPLTMFNEHRSLLFSIAYRMLGTVADAEDIVQDAFIRWQQASHDEIRSPKAFLVTIVSRLSSTTCRPLVCSG